MKIHLIWNINSLIWIWNTSVILDEQKWFVVCYYLDFDVFIYNTYIFYIILCSF